MTSPQEALSQTFAGPGSNGSIFPRKALSRVEMPWDDYLRALTPVELRDGLYYKREDYFAPLGYGGINGSKLRQLTYLIGRYAASHYGDRGVLTGASILSPQLSMATLVARHYGLPTTLVLGGTKPETAIRAENVKIAAAAGAEFVFIPVGYNPAIQRAVRDLHETPAYEAWYRLRYGITTPEDCPDADVEAFHRVGAHQASEAPSGIRTLVMTAGSCNSCVSVLYGIARNPQAWGALERIVLYGIGPTRLQWIEDRLAAIERVAVHEPECDLDADCRCGAGEPIRDLYRRRYHDHPALEEEHQTDGPILLEHIDLHARGVYSYGDRAPWSQDGIDFHPTYEGKMLTWIAGREEKLGFRLPRDGSVLVWIVGSAPSLAAMSEAFLLEGIRA